MALAIGAFDPILAAIASIPLIVAGVVAWRNGSRPAARLTAASMIIVTLTSLPAFFVDVPPVVRLLVATSVLLAVAAIVLMFSTERRPVPVMD